MVKTLIDSSGRQIKKLRVSLTDKCNLRCHYCMPVDAQFMSEDNYLRPLEYEEIIRDLIGFGLEEVRLTGGEPLMRKSFPEIVERLGALELKKLSLTTNGIFLSSHLQLLKRSGVLHLNISLDSLDKDNFKKITFGNHFDKVIEGIKHANEQGFIVKLNTVLMKGINDHEIFDFISFAEENKIEVRFLELMRIGHACQDQSQQFISAREVIDIIKTKHELNPMSVQRDSTSFNFVTDRGARIGFIASESMPFCGNCSRWRLSADGVLRACLLKNEGLSVKNIKDKAEIYHALLGMKPAVRPAEVTHHMNEIGG